MHAMMRGMIKVAVVTAASQCHSACMHFVVAHVLVTCAQAMPRGLLPPAKAEELYTAAVSWHFNAHAQDAFACVDYGFGDISMHMHRMRMRVLIKGVVATAPSYIFIVSKCLHPYTSYRIEMFAIRFRLSQLVLLKMTNAELIRTRITRRWTTFVQLCPNMPAVVTASTHIPIFLSPYLHIFPYARTQVAEALASLDVKTLIEDVVDAEMTDPENACLACDPKAEIPVPPACLHREYMCKQRW